MWKRIRLLNKKFKYNENEMPFLDHLEHLRKTLIYIFYSLFLGVILCFPFSKSILNILLKPAFPFIQSFDSLEKTFGVVLVFQEPTSSIKMLLLITFFGGLLLSLLAIIYFLASFILPGIRQNEQNALKKIIIFSGFLFLLGIFLGYEITLPLAMEWMLKLGNYLGGESIWFFSKYITFVLQIVLAFGLAFQLPVIIIVLGKMGFIGSHQLREKRRHVIIGLLIFAMLLTPPDVLTQLLLATPLILLYEFCIWFLHISGNRNAKLSDNENINEV